MHQLDEIGPNYKLQVDPPGPFLIGTLDKAMISLIREASKVVNDKCISSKLKVL